MLQFNNGPMLFQGGGKDKVTGNVEFSEKFLGGWQR